MPDEHEKCILTHFNANPVENRNSESNSYLVWLNVFLLRGVSLSLTLLIVLMHFSPVYQCERADVCASRAFEPAYEIMALFVLRKLILQTHMRSHQVGLGVWFLVGPFVYFHTLCVRTAKALARLRGCAGLPEPSLVAYVISTMSWLIYLFIVHVLRFVFWYQRLAAACDCSTPWTFHFTFYLIFLRNSTRCSRGTNHLQIQRKKTVVSLWKMIVSVLCAKNYECN